MTKVRGIRGAIRVADNSRDSIHAATRELLQAIIANNRLNQDDIASIFLTTTPDLNADFPAYAVRALGWKYVPLLGAQEVAVPGAMTRVVRVLLHVNSERPPHQIRHCYLGETESFRPDLAEGDSHDSGNED
jgi:chorismate mutase